MTAIITPPGILTSKSAQIIRLHVPLVELAALIPFTYCDDEASAFYRIHVHLTREHLLLIATNGKHLAVLNSLGRMEDRSPWSDPERVELEFDLPGRLVDRTIDRVRRINPGDVTILEFNVTEQTAALICQGQREATSISNFQYRHYPKWREIFQHHDHPHQSIGLNPQAIELFARATELLVGCSSLKCRLVSLTEDDVVLHHAPAVLVLPARNISAYSDRFCGMVMTIVPDEPHTTIPEWLKSTAV